MEKIVEEPPTSAVLLDHCHFSQVIFNSMEKFYVPGGDITCYYTFTQHFIPRRKDWIGIFRVGWKTTREYYTFMWVALPSDLKMDLAKQQEVQFKAYYLPKDDEYYQFCYVDQDGVVRGASIPFQFRLETEDDILVVTTKGKVEEIEQHNKELCEENQELKDSCVSLKKQNSDMQAELKRKQGKVEEIEQHNKELCEENQELKDSCVSLKKQNSDMQAELKRKQGKVEKIEQHNKELCEENQELKDSCVSLQKQNSDMQAELKRKQGELGTLHSTNNKLEEKVKEQKAYWETELLQLKENNQKVSSENEKMAIRVDQLQAQLLTQEKEMEKLVQGDQNKSEQLQHLKSENDQLFISLTEQKEHQKKLQQTVEEMKQKETITVKKQQKLMESRNKKTTVEDQLVQEVERLKAKVEAGKACYLEKYKECQRLHKQIRQLRAAALDENSKLCRQLSENKTLLDNLQREIEILERENDLLEKENGRLVRCTCQNFGLSLTRVPTSIQRGTDQNPRLRYGNPYSGVQESSASSLLSKK